MDRRTDTELLSVLEEDVDTKFDTIMKHGADYRQHVQRTTTSSIMFGSLQY